MPGPDARGLIGQQHRGARTKVAIERREKYLVVRGEISRYAQVHTVGSHSLERVEPQDAVPVVIEGRQRKLIKQAIARGHVNVSTVIDSGGAATCPDAARSTVGRGVEDDWRLREIRCVIAEYPAVVRSLVFVGGKGNVYGVVRQRQTGPVVLILR